MGYRRDNPFGMLGEHLKRSAGDLQAFRVFSQHPKWVITPVNPEKVLSICFYKILLSKTDNYGQNPWF